MITSHHAKARLHRHNQHARTYDEDGILKALEQFKKTLLEVFLILSLLLGIVAALCFDFGSIRRIVQHEFGPTMATVEAGAPNDGKHANPQSTSGSAQHR